MTIKIEVQLQKQIGLNVENILTKYLQMIPQEHLIGLERIIVVDRIGGKKNNETGGIYREKNQNTPATIEIALQNVYKEMPKVLYRMPFIPKFMLVNVLYHELGHHYQKRLSHGVRKFEQETFADQYSTKMLKKAFWWWLILLLPLKYLIIFLRNRSRWRLVEKGR